MAALTNHIFSDALLTIFLFYFLLHTPTLKDRLSCSGVQFMHLFLCHAIKIQAKLIPDRCLTPSSAWFANIFIPLHLSSAQYYEVSKFWKSAAPRHIHTAPTEGKGIRTPLFRNWRWVQHPTACLPCWCPLLIHHYLLVQVYRKKRPERKHKK